MIEHVEPVLEPSVQMAKELLIKVCDMSQSDWMNEDDELSNTLQALSAAFVQSGILSNRTDI